MYISISQDLSRQYSEEIVHAVATARQAGTGRVYIEATSRLARDLRWEFARYAGRLAKHLRK